MIASSTLLKLSVLIHIAVQKQPAFVTTVGAIIMNWGMSWSSNWRGRYFVMSSIAPGGLTIR